MTNQKMELGLSKSTSLYDSLETFEAAQRMAKSLAASDLVPDRFRGNIANVMIALEYAQRYKNWENPPHVMAIMQNLYVVKGNPAFEAKFVIALINSCGTFTRLDWEWIADPSSTAWGARAYANIIDRNGNPGKKLVGSLVDMNMAKGEGWLDKSGSKWQTMPEQMLQYRSASFWAKTYAPELIMGMNTIDEIIDSRQDDYLIVKSEVSQPESPLDAIANRLQNDEKGDYDQSEGDPSY